MINKKKLTRNFGIGLLFILLVIQFFHPKKNQSNDTTNDISNKFPIPDDVQQILRTACYDCHSNYTNYPWYSKIEPVDWWLNDHITKGKRALNFSEYSSYRIYKQYKRTQDIIEVLKKSEMPLDSYLWIHTDANLSAEQKEKLCSWAQAIGDTLKATYPADSLVNPNKKSRP
jgi:hypothetical protein